MEGELLEDSGEKVDEEVELTPPYWLPDGWVMEVKHGEDVSLYQVRSFCTNHVKNLRSHPS
jgi:hypothetical protein